MSTASNIICKNATLKIAAYGAAEGSAVDIGTLDGGVELERDVSYYEVGADDFMGPVAVAKTGEKYRIKCKMAESTQANLIYAWDYPTTAESGGTAYVGGNSTVTYRTLYINGDAIGGGTRKITVYKAVIVGSGAHAYKKDEKTVLEVEFLVLEDTSQTANQRCMKIVDTSTDTTAPTIAMTTPAQGGTVTKDTAGTVTLTITETNAMDEGTIIYGNSDDATVMIINTTGGAYSLVAGSIAYSSVAKTITFTPTSNWTASDTLMVIVTTGLKDVNGNRLASMFSGTFSVTA